MVKEAIGTGETVLAAQEAACKELGVETHEAEFEVLQMPEKKLSACSAAAPLRCGLISQPHQPRRRKSICGMCSPIWV